MVGIERTGGCFDLQCGLIPRMFVHLFQRIAESEETRVSPPGAPLHTNTAACTQPLSKTLSLNEASRDIICGAQREGRETKILCRCSFLEIYKEDITDLLNPASTRMQIREDIKTGVYVDNITQELVFSSGNT